MLPQWSNPLYALLWVLGLSPAAHGSSFIARQPFARRVARTTAAPRSWPGSKNSSVAAAPVAAEVHATQAHPLAFAVTAAKEEPLPTNSSNPGDYNRETPWREVTPWKEDQDQRLPFSVEATIAFVWVTMVAAMPFIVIKLEGKDFTKVQAVVFFIMWVILFGGVFLFTQILYFQSAHFDTQRHLTVVESVYFLAQVLTTVGYGDVTPARPRAQVFVALYVLFSLLVIANVISEVGACISKHVRRVGSETMKRWRQAQELVQDQWDTITGGEEEKEIAEEASPGSSDKMTPRMRLRRKSLSYFELKPPALDFLSVLGSSIQFIFFVVLGVSFYHNYPGENKTLFDSIYMSVITLSTVGFGVITPQTEAGKVFGAFWMLFGSGALVGLVGSLTDLYGQIKVRELWNQRDLKQERTDFIEALPEELDKYEFFKQSLLFKGTVEASDLEALEAIFDHMKKRADGMVSKTDVQEILATNPSSESGTAKS